MGCGTRNVINLNDIIMITYILYVRTWKIVQQKTNFNRNFLHYRDGHQLNKWLYLCKRMS